MDMLKEISNWQTKFSKDSLQYEYFELVKAAYKNNLTYHHFNISVRQHLDQYKSIHCNPTAMFELLYHTYHPVRNIIEMSMEPEIKSKEEITNDSI